jgi:MFS family permease
MPLDTPIETPVEVPEEPRKRFYINRNFALLASGQAISNIGDFVYNTTLLVWVFVLTHSATAVSGVLVAQYVPIFALGPVAGVFVDRWNRRTTMVATDLLRMGVALLPLALPGNLRLPGIYLSVFLISTFSRFFMPARSGVLQVIVSDRQQGQAASISQATFALAFIIGPAIASPLYFLVGPVIACIINAVSYLVSTLCLLAIHASKESLRPFVASGRSGIQAVFSELVAGLRFVARTRVLLIVVGMVLIAMLGAGALNALDIIFVSQRLHVSTSLYGPLTAVSGLGTLVGAILAGVLISRLKPRLILAGSVLLLGIGLTIYAFQTWYVAALVLYFFGSIPQGGIDVGFTPLLLNSTPRAMMGRVQSVIETAMYGMSLVSVALAGYLGQFIPVYVIFAASGVLIALSGLFAWFALPKEKPAA